MKAEKAALLSEFENEFGENVTDSVTENTK
jgi:hypothetical protein